MVPVSRRRFVAAGSLLALAGCLSRGDEESDDRESDDGASDDPDEGATDLWGALGPLPRTVEDEEVRLVQVAIPQSDEAEAGTFPAPATSPLDLDPEAVDRRGHARFRDAARDTVSTAVGSFDAAAVGDSDDAAVHAEDGVALAASSGSEPWTEGLDAARAAHDDPEVGVAAERPLELLLEPIADREQILCLPSVTEEDAPDATEVDVDDLSSLAMGVDVDVEAREQRLTYVVLFAEGTDPDEETMRAVLESDGTDQFADAEIQVDGRLATATATVELSPGGLPDDSPDAWFRIRYDGEAGATVLELTGEESVDASNLQLRVDGEVVDPPWDDDATLEPERTFEVDAEPFSHVEVRWVDPEREGVHQALGRTVVGGRDAFEGSYDLDARELTITYTGDSGVDADRFDLEWVSPDRDERETESFGEHADALEPGEEVVLEDVAVGEQVVLSITVETEAGEHSQSVLWHRAEPPGRFGVDVSDGSRVLVYRSESAQPASDYRVTVDGEPADTQPADVHDTLETGDEVPLDVEPGVEVTVEYVGGEEPYELLRHVTRPQIAFTFERDGSTVEITHDGGESVPAEDLVVLVHSGDPEERPDVWAAEYETVERGDSVVVAVPAETDDGGETEDSEEVDDGDETDDAEEPGELEVVAVLYDGHPLDYREFQTEDED